MATDDDEVVKQKRELIKTLLKQLTLEQCRGWTQLKKDVELQTPARLTSSLLLTRSFADSIANGRTFCMLHVLDTVFLKLGKLEEGKCG